MFLFANCWVPDRMYHLMPWLCLAAGTAAWMLPKGVVVVLCALYLYGYGGLMLWRRLVELCRYN